MGFRTIKINSRCKLQTELNYLVYRGETEKKIALDEIETLIIENQQVCITSSLLSELINHKVTVIFCDRMHNPLAELVPYHGAYNTMARIKAQLNWSQEIKDFVWARIIKQKIRNQAEILKANKKLGQNFLINSEVVESIVNSSEITKEDMYLIYKVLPKWIILHNHLSFDAWHLNELYDLQPKSQFHDKKSTFLYEIL